MELLIALALMGSGVGLSVLSVYLTFRKKKPKPVQLSSAEQIAAETARLEAENRRLEREYETLRDAELEALHISSCSCNECLGKRYLSLPEEVRKPPLGARYWDSLTSAPNKPLIGPKTRTVIEGRQFEADCRAVRIKAEFAYYQQFGRLPPDSLLDNHGAARLTSFYESSRAKTFNTVPLILTDGTRIEFKFRKLS